MCVFTIVPLGFEKTEHSIAMSEPGDAGVMSGGMSRIQVSV